MIETELGDKPVSVKIAFLDVGQADTIVISSTDTQEAIIVDCVDANAVLTYLASEQVKYLRGVFITHLHADHYSGVANLLDNYREVPGMQECEVVAFNEDFNQKNLKQLTPDKDGHSSSYEQPPVGGKKLVPVSLLNLVRWCKQHPMQCANLKVEQRPLPIKGALEGSLKLLHPYFADYFDLRTEGLNNASAVLRIGDSKASALLTGDLEPEGWIYLCSHHPDLHSDVLKFPHHGGAWKGNIVDDLLDRVDPSIVVISVGSDGFKKYTHPHPDVFTALARRSHIRVLCTQATDQCQQLVQSKRTSAIHQFKAEASKNRHQLFLSKKGCPCAGTIVIELSDKAHVLQPEIEFHREIIIRPHFQIRKCCW